MCVCVCAISVLQRVSLCYTTVLSQDYIPAEHRAGKYLLFIVSIGLSVCVFVGLSPEFAPHILTGCLYSVVSQVKHTHTHMWGKY